MADNKNIIIIKRIKKGGHGHHGGAWKVAYADFVTAMMCFFLVMWLMGADEDTKAAIAGYFNHPELGSGLDVAKADPKGGTKIEHFRDETPPGGRMMNMPAGKVNVTTVTDDALTQLKELLEESLTLDLGVSSREQVTLSYDPEALLVRIVAKDLFNEHDSNFRSDMKPILHAVGRVLAQSTHRLIRVEGHADSRENNPRDPSYAWRLSSSRAQTVAQYWFSQFRNLDPKRVTLAANSFHHPIRASHSGASAGGGGDQLDEVDRAQNRRVEIYILNKTLSDHEEELRNTNERTVAAIE